MNNQNSISDTIIAFLGSGRSTSRFYKILRERELARYKEQSISVGISRMSKNGLIKKQGDIWSLTKKGEKRYAYMQKFKFSPSPFSKDTAPSVIISFDIPESFRFGRNWLRNQLKIFGYKMIHRSLWVGPGPLPIEFKKVIKGNGLIEHMKIYSIKQKTKI